jgi:hypothetical protein
MCVYIYIYIYIYIYMHMHAYAYVRVRLYIYLLMHVGRSIGAEESWHLVDFFGLANSLAE